MSASPAPPEPGRVLALIPAWNEAGRLGPVVAGARRYLPVLVVDDGSTDGTAEAARAAGAQVLRHERNRGKGVALLTGFKHALAEGYDAVLTLDADGQHDPADIPRFLQAFAEGRGDLIIGRRDFRRMPFPRRYTNPFGSWLLSLALGVPVYDSQSGYRLHSRRLLEAMDLKTMGFELETEEILQAVVLGFRLAWVPIRTLYGVGEVSYYHPLRDSARFLAMVWRALRARRRAGAQGG